MINRVAIIVPAYNASETIKGTIEGLLSQTLELKPADIIVVDNDSEDDTALLAARMGVRVIIETKKGAYAARNAGILQLDDRYRYVAFTDSDCYPRADWLESLLVGFEDNGVAACGGEILPYDITNPVERYIDNKGILRQRFMYMNMPYSKPFFVTANVAFQADVFSKVGLFDDSLAISGDADLCWRLQAAGLSLKYIPDAVVYHKHRTTTTALYNQGFQYGYGTAELMSIHLYKTYNKRIWIDWKSYSAVRRALLGLIGGFFSATSYYDHLYDLIWYSAFIYGKWKGSLEKRIIVI